MPTADGAERQRDMQGGISHNEAIAYAGIEM